MGRSRSREKEEKKEKKKKRSRSSESAERSREREKRRRKEQHDMAKQNAKASMGAPPGMPALPGAPPGMGAGPPGMGGPMPGVTAGQQMFWDGFQWVPRAASADGSDVNATRKMRRLYLGNLPYHLGVTEDSFSTQLYNTMKERGLCNDAEQNPVMHVWFAREKGANYGFVEMASVEETERALQLDGMMVCGVPVTIKRINDTVSPLAQIANAAQMGRPGMPPAPGMPGSNMLALPQVLATATSKVIRIAEILKYEPSTTAKEDFEDVTEDMNEGCGQHGKLKKAYIVRPDDKKRLPGPDYAIGDVFLVTDTVEDATKIMRAMGHRKYDGRQISMKSFEEDVWLRSVQPILAP